MVRRKPQYVVDSHGRKKAVLLGVKEYLAMLDRLEEMEDALELDEARRSDDGFRDYREVREELKKDGIL